MSAELRIPEGIVVRTARGGSNVLAGILSDLKQYSFTGYVKVILKKESMCSAGYLVVDQGIPTMSIYQFEKTQPRDIKRIYAGDKSMRFIVEDSQDRQAVIELHSGVPKEEFDRRFPDAKLLEMDNVDLKTLVQQAPPQKEEQKGKPKEPEPAVPEEVDPVLADIRKFRQQGYVVDELEKLFKQNKAMAKKEIPKFQEKVDEIRRLEKQLDNLPQIGFENEIQSIKLRLNDPSNINDIRNEIVTLKDNMKRQIEQVKMAEKDIEEDLKKKQRDEKSGDLYDLILQYQRGQIPKQETPVCERCGSVLDGKGVCPKCKEKEDENLQLALTEGMGFQSFIVGKSNKFAYAAAVAVAHAPDKAYNPLFLYGKSGLGKTHLLNAIARQILDKNSKDNVVLIPAERFAEELARAIKNNDVHGFRDKMRRKKLFMIDDFQFLAGKEAAQEELLHLIEEILQSGGQIVVASDRLPKEVPHLSEHLSAKILGGMIADIQSPDKQTRIEIIKRKAKEKGKDIPPLVLEFISDRVQSNVRELESALNRLIAFSTVMKLNIDLQLAKEVLTPTIGASVEEKESELEIKPGHSYLIEEDRPVQSNRMFAKKIKEGYKGLEITRMNPSQVRSDYGISGEIIWLTDKESKNERTISPSLEMIVHTIEEFMGQGEKEILLVDGLQYLISNTSFEGVLRFLRRLIDDFSESGSIMMISVSPGTLNPQELSILEREFEVLKQG